MQLSTSYYWCLAIGSIGSAKMKRVRYSVFFYCSSILRRAYGDSHEVCILEIMSFRISQRTGNIESVEKCFEFSDQVTRIELWILLSNDIVVQIRVEVDSDWTSFLFIESGNSWDPILMAFYIPLWTATCLISYLIISSVSTQTLGR